jgi:hypothetical protein
MVAGLGARLWVINVFDADRRRVAMVRTDGQPTQTFSR